MKETINEQRKLIFRNARAMMGAKKINMKTLAEKSGIHPSQIGRYFDISSDLNLTTLLKICIGLDCTLLELLTFKRDDKVVNSKLDEILESVKNIENTLSQNVGNN